MEQKAAYSQLPNSFKSAMMVLRGKNKEHFLKLIIRKRPLRGDQEVHLEQKLSMVLTLPANVSAFALVHHLADLDEARNNIVGAKIFRTRIQRLQTLHCYDLMIRTASAESANYQVRGAARVQGKTSVPDGAPPRSRIP
ncbi:uncharacterized protein CLUP02_06459 [Colletotrichum lupini]|uniref:Uncharacterized protein n=1 Tax=Colletotrichum lupini TaxID=145971 RepID=A0A9Q8SPN6_9PEZI|nr:uncharacterized protein CLUP02_06459 [Colletotrichum lupini]UQC80973.1 hypothetical protein CLUP02_06459 [Colletotrichum lupini]